METTIKDIRVSLDKITKQSKSLNKTRELSLVITNFEESKMWLGKVLKSLGTANPYPESRNPESKVIEKTADTYEGDKNKDFENLDQIGKVKYLRSVAIIIANDIHTLTLGKLVKNPESFELVKQSWFSCTKADMWLGMELARIANESNSENEELKKSLDLSGNFGNTTTSNINLDINLSNTTDNNNHGGEAPPQL